MQSVTILEHDGQLVRVGSAVRQVQLGHEAKYALVHGILIVELVIVIEVLVLQSHHELCSLFHEPFTDISRESIDVTQPYLFIHGEIVEDLCPHIGTQLHAWYTRWSFLLLF